MLKVVYIRVADIYHPNTPTCWKKQRKTEGRGKDKEEGKQGRKEGGREKEKEGMKKGGKEGRQELRKENFCL